MKTKTKKTPKKVSKPRRKAKLSVRGKKEKSVKVEKVKKIEEDLTPRKETEEIKVLETKPVKYFESVGRRKTAVARVRLFTQGEKEFSINEKPYQKYFPSLELQQIADAALRRMKCLDKFKIVVKVRGGGIHAQAEAVRHGITRALVEFNPDFRKRLRRAGYLTRDPRERERKKFGLKRARRAPQWRKR